MINWQKFLHKKVFVQLNNGKQYSGTVDAIDDSDKPIIHIALIDKFGQDIVFLTSEILHMEEE